MKKEDLKENEIYFFNGINYDYIIRLSHIDEDVLVYVKSYITNSPKVFNSTIVLLTDTSDIGKFKPATKEQIKHLEACEKEDKYVDLKENFYPIY